MFDPAEFPNIEKMALITIVAAMRENLDACIQDARESAQTCPDTPPHMVATVLFAALVTARRLSIDTDHVLLQFGQDLFDEFFKAVVDDPVAVLDIPEDLANTLRDVEVQPMPADIFDMYCTAHTMRLFKPHSASNIFDDPISCWLTYTRALQHIAVRYQNLQAATPVLATTPALVMLPNSTKAN